MYGQLWYNKVMASTAKKGRLEARVSLSLKDKLEKAAAIKGLNLSSFVTNTMEEVATEIISEHEKLKLSLEEQHAFFDALMSPPEPNKKMLAAARRYHKI